MKKPQRVLCGFLLKLGLAISVSVSAASTAARSTITAWAASAATMPAAAMRPAASTARPITTIMLSATGAHGFAIGFFAVEVWLFFVFIEIAATLKGNSLFRWLRLLRRRSATGIRRWSSAVSGCHLGALLAKNRLARKLNAIA